MSNQVPWNKDRKMPESFRAMRSEVQREVWRDSKYRQHMVAIHTGKRYPSASLKKRGRIPWNKSGVTLACMRCGKPFHVSDSRRRRPGTRSPKYCSLHCLGVANTSRLLSIRANAARKHKEYWKGLSPIERERRLNILHEARRGCHVSQSTREKLRGRKVSQENARKFGKRGCVKSSRPGTRELSDRCSLS